MPKLLGKVLVALMITVGLLALIFARPKPPSQAKMVVCRDLLQGCHLGDGLLQLDQTPAPLKPFTLKFTHPTASMVKATLNMQGMTMPPNTYRLIAENGIWHARIILPFCIQGRADWQLVLYVTEGGGLKAYKVGFKSAKVR